MFKDFPDFGEAEWAHYRAFVHPIKLVIEGLEPTIVL